MRIKCVFMDNLEEIFEFWLYDFPAIPREEDLLDFNSFLGEKFEYTMLKECDEIKSCEDVLDNIFWVPVYYIQWTRDEIGVYPKIMFEDNIIKSR